MYDWSYEYLVELPDADEHMRTNLDEKPARDVHNLDELARKPYEWYNNLVELSTPLLLMSTPYLAQKRKVSVNLDLDCYGDLDAQVLRVLDWHKILMLESDETVEVTVSEQEEDDVDQAADILYSQ